MNCSQVRHACRFHTQATVFFLSQIQFHDWCGNKPNQRVTMVHLPGAVFYTYPPTGGELDPEDSLIHARLTGVVHRHRSTSHFSEQGRFYSEIRAHSSGLSKPKNRAEGQNTGKESSTLQESQAQKADAYEASPHSFPSIAKLLYDPGSRDVAGALSLAAGSEDPNAILVHALLSGMAQRKVRNICFGSSCRKHSKMLH